jgi:hypothetical protein
VVPDNGPVRARKASPIVRTAAVVAAVAAVTAVAGCGSDATPPAATPSSAPVAGTAAGAAVEPRADLARRVAAAKDRRFVAAYAWTGSGAPRTVTVTLAADGTWRVDIPGGAEGGPVRGVAGGPRRGRLPVLDERVRAGGPGGRHRAGRRRPEGAPPVHRLAGRCWPTRTPRSR